MADAHAHSQSRRVWRRSLLALAVAMVPVAVLAGCGDDEGPSNDGGGIVIEHVHGLGVNPADRALYVATHDGMVRVEPGSGQVEPVGEAKQDTMGFTVVDPDEFLGSGHPGPGDGGPTSLGLIASNDGGQSWENVSLNGQADFHILRYGSGRIYAFDALSGQLLVSDDEGASWERREAPRGLIDLALDPADPDHVLAATQNGVLESSDGGARWRPLADAVGLLAWPDPNRLFLIDARGRAQQSDDDGRSWESLGSIGAQPSALVADGPDEFYAARVDGAILASDDGGASWDELQAGGGD